MTQQEYVQIIPELRSLTLRIGRRFFHSAADAEDVAQESLLLVWQYRQLLKSREEAVALASRVAKRICVDLYRKRRRVVKLDEETASQLKGSQLEADQEVRVADASRELWQAMEQMIPRHRELLRWHDLEKLEMDEIVRRSGIKESSVRSIISRARNLLMKELKKRFGSD